MRKYDYAGTVYCDSLGIDIAGFFDRENCEILKENSTVQVVPIGMQFRPDKVAAYYLGSPDYY